MPNCKCDTFTEGTVCTLKSTILSLKESIVGELFSNIRVEWIQFLKRVTTLGRSFLSLAIPALFEERFISVAPFPEAVPIVLELAVKTSFVEGDVEGVSLLGDYANGMSLKID